MDGYLVEQHSYVLRREAQVDTVPNENSWVMLTQTGGIVRLTQEIFLMKSRSRITLEINPPANSDRTRPDNLPLKHSYGSLYLTNQRVIYLPDNPTSAFKSFAAPILNIQDSFVDSRLLGSWFWKAKVIPVPDGGIPIDYPVVDVKFIFNDGGHSEWQQKFETIKANLQHAHDIGASFSSAHLEPLPQYSPPSREIVPPPAAAETPSSQIGNTTGSNPPIPNEPPPDYEEAQAQAVNQILREEQERRNEP